jgi:peptide/nickel transport system permease protein
MLRFAASRILWGIPSLLIMSALLYFCIGGMLGSPSFFLLGLDATPDAVAALDAKLGFDRPLYVQYFDWLWHVLHGDLGTSYITRQPAWDIIWQALPITFEISVYAIILSVSASVIINTAAGKSKIVNFLINVAAIAGITLPNFVLGTFLIYILSVHLGLLPTLGWSSWEDGVLEHYVHLILPVLTISGYFFGATTLTYRPGFQTVARQPMARLARAKGASPYRVAFMHVMPNAILPVVSFVGIIAGQIVGGAVVTETLFSIPGLGSLFVQSIMGRDFPLMLAMGMFLIASVIVVSAITDIVYAYLNPRIRIE